MICRYRLLVPVIPLIKHEVVKIILKIEFKTPLGQQIRLSNTCIKYKLDLGIHSQRTKKMKN